MQESHAITYMPTNLGKRLYNWEPFMGTNLLEVGIAKGLGAVNGLRSSKKMTEKCTSFQFIKNQISGCA